MFIHHTYTQHTSKHLSTPPPSSLLSPPSCSLLGWYEAGGVLGLVLIAPRLWKLFTPRSHGKEIASLLVGAAAALALFGSVASASAWSSPTLTVPKVR